MVLSGCQKEIEGNSWIRRLHPFLSTKRKKLELKKKKTSIKKSHLEASDEKNSHRKE